MATVQPSKSTRDEALRRKNARIADEFKGACPNHRIKDLEALVKEVKGDKTKIQERLEEWWEEPEIEEKPWSDVKRGHNKKKIHVGIASKRDVDNVGQPRGSSSSRRDGSGGGRGYSRRGSSEGGRGRGAERRSDNRGSRGRSSRSHSHQGGSSHVHHGPPPPPAESVQQEESTTIGEDGTPSPVRIAPAPKGAWGKLSEPAAVPPQPTEPDNFMPEAEAPPLPSLSVQTTSSHSSMKSSSGNVWGTKGGAHLILAEKKPVVLPAATAAAPPQVLSQQPTRSKDPEKVTRESSRRTKARPPKAQQPLEVDGPLTVPHVAQVVVEEAQSPPSPQISQMAMSPMTEKPVIEQQVPLAPLAIAPEPPIEDSLPPSVNGNNVNAVGWKPAASQSMPQPVVEPVLEPIPLAPVVPPKSLNTLKLGRWGAAEDNDSDQIDFGFGSFEGEAAAPSPLSDNDDEISEPIEEEQAPPPPAAVAPPPETAAVPPTSPSPKRPPPGLSINNMPPMPVGATLVSELEGRLESAVLTVEAPAPPEDSPPETAPVVPVVAPAPPVPATTLSSDGGAAQPPAPLPSGPSPPAPQAPAPPPAVSAGPLPSTGGFANYGGAGAYAGYGAPGLGGGLPGAPAFGAAVPQTNTPTVPPKAVQQGGLGGSAASGAPGSGLQTNAGQSSAGLYGAPGVVGAGTDIGAVSNTPVDGGVPSAVPPGMNAGLYSNPMYYSQQYNYGGGVPAGYPFGYSGHYGMQSGMQTAGYAYAQQIGQNGYPPYDDVLQHPQHNSHQSGGGQYNKSGGYRRNNHHNNTHQNNNNYHNQYNPQQQAGYGQPYNMGGHYGDPFNRTGYGHMNMDHYSMPNSGYPNSGPSVSGFGQDGEDGGSGQYLKKKGGNRSGGSGGGRDFGNPQMQFQSGQQATQAPAQAPPNGTPFSLQGSMEGSNGASNGWGGPNWNAQMPSWQGA
uniref:Uncharacterized protein n=1 Tax=Corethron hystrix TaxID=216773 RepID=A0A7S1BTX8_9STRA|mmetsp:Transcript_40923/g.96031  ORF Transcript_40923/g.96031 Transcript_40923/m.96031 type:complete len:947 (+) Transcript_40923:119-2959(+)